MNSTQRHITSSKTTIRCAHSDAQKARARFKGVSGMSNFKLLVLCLIVFLSQPTLGCEEYDEIDLGNLEKYSEIFVGEVMGVTLDAW